MTQTTRNAPGVGWWASHRYEVIRDLLVGLIVGALLLGATVYLENRLATRQERLENVRFVRQTVMDAKAVKPFSGLDLQDAYLAGLPMGCTEFGPNDLRIGCADFTDADLAGVNLSDSDLTGANFSQADLTNADLRGADLSLADLSGADLSGADLTGSDITSTSFGGNDTWRHATIKDVCREKGYRGGPHPPSNDDTCTIMHLRAESRVIP